MALNSSSSEQYFAQSYLEGRTAFLKACAQLGLEPQSHVHPSLKGPEGEELAVDHVWIGPGDAEKVLLFSCGTHGLEAAVGAATLRHWLATGEPLKLPHGIAVLIIHAINPYGWAWSRRGNEDGVDLNRNFVDQHSPYPRNPAYSELHPLIADATIDESGLESFIRDFQDFSARKGPNYAIGGIASGQYDHPDGLSFGGRKPSWSREILFRIAGEHLGQARKVLHIDWHTGIGKYGEAHFILDDSNGSPAFELASAWWPEHDIHCDEVIEGLSIDYQGLLTTGLQQFIIDLNAADMVSLTIEWGTYEVEAMLLALLIDNWLIHRADTASQALARAAQFRLIERFSPGSTDWRDSVISKSEAIYAQAIAGLHAW